ncbi:hypothetical protein [Bradyrhizobium sp. WSM1743]|uniref:hypothetical protein n=1 Tax=Bradyrhizobium sp. WSM1743 TaxID=318996 RepID=UPI00048490B2|nr:hypothetical protein [Bradyrhizobium sp. WSM1743]
MLATNVQRRGRDRLFLAPYKRPALFERLAEQKDGYGEPKTLRIVAMEVLSSCFKLRSGLVNFARKLPILRSKEGKVYFQYGADILVRFLTAALWRRCRVERNLKLHMILHFALPMP